MVKRMSFWSMDREEVRLAVVLDQYAAGSWRQDHPLGTRESGSEGSQGLRVSGSQGLPDCQTASLSKNPEIG